MNMDLTEILVIMDRSGSMGRVREDAIGGFNTLIEDQKECPGEARVTLIQFSTDYETICDHVPVEDVVPLTNETYVPRGWTGMLDAIINGIDDLGVALNLTPEEERPGKVLVVIITDGEENRSTEYPAHAGGYDVCRERVQHQTDVYNWQFLFLAANQDAVLEGGKIGVKADRAKGYTHSKIGTQSAYKGASQALCAMRCDAGDAAVERALSEVQ